MLKPFGTLEFLCIDIDTYRKWIESQMTIKMNWLNIETDRVKPLCTFDVFKDEELKEAFN